MKIYTRQGDRGETQLFNGERRSKDDIIFEVLGNIDELNAHIGLLVSLIEQNNGILLLKEELIKIMSILFDVSSAIATPLSSTKNKSKLNRVSLDYDKLIIDIEMSIDKYMNMLPPLKNFILPCGTTLSSYAHITRAICRRCERSIVLLFNSTREKKDFDENILKYFNRLSDFFFAVSRILNNKDKEILYKKSL
jgi:cob(I)alamin adenosyltransferase